jgi:hypothetical protein
MIAVFANCANGDAKFVKIRIIAQFVQGDSTYMMDGVILNAQQTLNLI